METDTRPIAFEHDMPLATWKEANFNDEAIAFGYPATGVNSLLLPKEGNRLVRRINQKYGVQANYGSYMEDRSFLWRGHPQQNPLEKQHLGVDYNVPAHIRVSAPHGFRVVHVWRDPNQNDGWGGRLVVWLDREYRGARYVIFGHLGHSSLPQMGDYFKRGEIFGIVGETHENGGWYEHLHVQMLSEHYYASYQLSLESIDGYGPTKPSLPDMPDPSGWMSGLLA